MNYDEAKRAVSNTARATAVFATGDMRDRGRIIACTDKPMVCVLTDSGEHVWWLAELVNLEDSPAADEDWWTAEDARRAREQDGIEDR